MSTTVEEIETTKTTEDKKDELLLDSLEIKGYRCFEHLTIEKLGRVNLIVGKNNVGKTALLEALWIYTRRGKIDSLLNLLYSRDEVYLYFEKPSRVGVPKTEEFIKKTEILFQNSQNQMQNFNSKLEENNKLLLQILASIDAKAKLSNK